MTEDQTKPQPSTGGSAAANVDFATRASTRLVKRPEYYLAPATNEMYRLLVTVDVSTTSVSDTDQANLVAAAAVGCRALGWLTADAEFKTDVESLSRRLATTRETVASIVGDPEQFEQFLAVERQVLLQLGMDTEVTDQLLDRCVMELRTLSQGGATATQLLESINALRAQICQHATALRHAPQKQLPAGTSKHDLRFRLLEATFGVGGAALMGVNGGMLIATLGVSGAVSAMSVGMGGALVGAAVAKLLDSAR